MALLSRFWALLRRATELWRARNPSLIAAGLAYYALFSLIPLAVLSISVASRLFAISNARELVIAEIAEFFSPETAESIALLVIRVERSAGPASLASAVVLAWVGSRLFLQLQIALTAIWLIVPEARSRFGRVKAYVGNRARAMAATVCFGLLAFAFFVTDVVLAYFHEFIASILPGFLVFRILPAANLAASLILFTLAFAIIYRWLPASHPGWRAVWSGAAMASALFAGGRVAMAAYLHRRNLLTVFGAAGSVAVVLIWVYYSMQILLFGATFAAAVGERKQKQARNPALPSV